MRRVRDRDGVAFVRHASVRSAVAIVAGAFLLFAGLSACGGGGGGADAQPLTPPLRVVRSTPPNFQVGQPAVWALTASGGTPPYVFTAVPGQGLPPSNLKILPSGSVSGTPLVPGTGAFVVQVTDAATPSANATSQFVFEVGGFDVVVDAVVTPDPWTDSSYRVRSPGGSLSVTYQVLSSAGGSVLSDPDPAARSVTVVTGSTPGNDRLRATQSNGKWTDVTIRIEQNPVVHHVARFDTTDVWFVLFAGKEDTAHGFVSDFDRSLAQFGLRAPASTDAVGTAADRFAKLYVEQRVLSRLGEIYLNNPDGTPAPAGLAISFPFEEPGIPYDAPAEGTQELADPGDYNVIGVQAGVANAFDLGWAFYDTPSNDHVESVLPSPGSRRRGIFVDGLHALLSPAFFSAALTATPVGAPDLPALRALVYQLPSPGGRYDEIKRVADGWANVLAIWLAHEIAHCLSLQHTQGIMLIDVNWLLVPGATPTFGASDVGILRTALPGAGR